ncbi:MAG: hypothetical protein ACE5GL_02835, partial [Calditrichia bacterium]
SSSRSVVVLRKAQIEVTGLSHPSLVSRGQSNIPVDISVFNSGEVAANIRDFNFTHAGLYVIDSFPPYPDILPGDTVTYNFLFDVLPNSGTGTDLISISILGKDSISSNVVTADSSFSWVIEVESNVEIVSVNPSQSIVSRGQSGVGVSVILRNQGGVSVLIDSVALQFSNGDTNYTGITLGSLTDTLFSGGVDTLQLSVGVNSNAVTGSEIIDASVFGVNLTTTDPIIVSGATTPGSWTVQQRPQIAVPSLTLSSDTVSTGQGGLALNFRLSNIGGGVPTATAQVDSIHLVINGMEGDTTQFSFTPQFNTPFVMVNNAELLLSYSLSVSPTALSGNYRFQSTVYYQDINDGNLFNLSGGSGASDTVLVQQAGSIVIDSVRTPVSSASVGQTGIPVQVYFSNPGKRWWMLGLPRSILTE